MSFTKSYTCVILIVLSPSFKLYAKNREKINKSKNTLCKGKNTWISPEGQDILCDGMFINEIIPKHFRGKVLSICPNPRFNMVHFVEIGKKVPVLMPNRLKDRFLGKVICFEVIESETGVSYRYVKG